MCKVESTGIWASAKTMGCYGHHKTRVCSTCEEGGGRTPPAQAQSECISSRVSWGAIHNLLEMLQPCNYTLPLKITLHLSNWIRLHFIMLILDTVSAHFKSLNNRHPSQLWEDVYEEEQLSGIRSCLWRHLPASNQAEMPHKGSVSLLPLCSQTH